MGTRGLWNLRVDDCWYRLCHSTPRVSPPDSVQTTNMAIKIRDMSLDLEKWHKVPFPSPFSPSFDYVYTVNRDAGTFIISMQERHAYMFMPVSLEATLAEICEAPGISIENLRQRSPPFFPDCEGHNNPKLDPGTWKEWFHPVNLPTAMTELSQLFFIDFVSMWRPWIGDPMSWHYGSPVFKCISRALLRLASWDFEVLYTEDAPLPVSHSSIPAWEFPESEHYWFHGFLVLLQPDLEWPQSLRAAVERSQSLINTSGRIPQRTQSILISPQDIVFVEFSSGEIKCSEVFPLMTDSSSMECSPGFRLLSQTMSSSCSRVNWAYREKWSLPLPSEVLANILQVSEPRDAVSFAQSSFKVEQWYYDSLPQIQDIELQHLHLSVPCCGDRTGLETLGIHCSECGIWQHAKCLGLETLPSENSFVCASCLNPDPKSSMLTAGGIWRPGGSRSDRKHVAVKTNETAKTLQVRRSRPLHLRPELRIRGDLIDVMPKGLIHFSIQFNGVFAGLAYGMDEPNGRFTGLTNGMYDIDDIILWAARV